MQAREECVALVLRYGGAGLSLLSLQEGRVEKRWFTPRHRAPLHRGSLVSYFSDKRQGHIETLEQLDLELCATELGFKDIYLLHYILEACHNFIPIGSEAQHLFYFLVELFHHFQSFPTCAQKKRVLCKLFALLGIYPEHEMIHAMANHLREMPIDKLLEAPLELDSEELMGIWLSWCIEMHPKGKFFKAMPLLLEK